MTEEQQTAVRAAFEDIQRMPGGSALVLGPLDGIANLFVIQYAPNRKYGKTLCILQTFGKKEIRQTMVTAAEEILEAAGGKKR